jgi:subtilase family serine protease
VTSLSWNPVSPNVGNSVSFTTTVKNQGAAGTTNFETALYIDGTRINILARFSLAAGASKTDSFSYLWTATSGSHPIKVKVDNLGEIAESNEGNNELAQTLTVQVTVQNPTLGSNPYLDPTSVQTGQSFTAYYYISNPNSFSINVGLGCSIRLVGTSGDGISDIPNDKIVSVSPGSNWYSRSFTVSSTTTAG